MNSTFFSAIEVGGKMVEINFIYGLFSLTTGLKNEKYAIFVRGLDDVGRYKLITTRADDIPTAKRLANMQVEQFKSANWLFEPIVNIPAEYLSNSDMPVFKAFADARDSGIWRVDNDGNKMSLWYSKRPPEQQNVDEPADTTTEQPDTATTTTQTDQDSGTAQSTQQNGQQTAFNPFAPFIQFIEFVNNLIRGTLPR